MLLVSACGEKIIIRPKEIHGVLVNPGMGITTFQRYHGDALNAGLNGLLAVTVSQQSTFSAGLRWDALPDVAFKLQVDRVRPRDGSRGTLINVQPDFRSGRAKRDCYWSA